MNKAMTRILTTLSALLLLYLGVVMVASVAQLADAADRTHPRIGATGFLGAADNLRAPSAHSNRSLFQPSQTTHPASRKGGSPI